jgi:hypothetical protein
VFHVFCRSVELLCGRVCSCQQCRRDFEGSVSVGEAPSVVLHTCVMHWRFQGFSHSKAPRLRACRDSSVLCPSKPLSLQTWSCCLTVLFLLLCAGDHIGQRHHAGVPADGGLLCAADPGVDPLAQVPLLPVLHLQGKQALNPQVLKAALKLYLQLYPVGVKHERCVSIMVPPGYDDGFTNV